MNDIGKRIQNTKGDDCKPTFKALNFSFKRELYNKRISKINEAPLGVFGIRDIRGKNYRDTGYLRKKLLGYRILRSSFRDTGYSQKIVT